MFTDEPADTQAFRADDGLLGSNPAPNGQPRFSLVVASTFRSEPRQDSLRATPHNGALVVG
jgi:hypothetical protein